MTHPFYEFTIHNEALRFEFISVSQRVIRKVIVYQKLPFPNAYNLALGDIDEQGKADFEVTSDNGDRDYILATVIQTLIAFFEKHPRATVFITGSTPSRTRLYQAVIARELAEIQKRFEISGVTEMGDEPFRKGAPYKAFVISPK
ncbi:DUF6934 family protein [Spirosoma sp. KUDC1026]|uniref:DUF6934 family protein n=1 Tax=Spirosoma sp. KUDC1026 TaxID=2745947 RepID=UPI00159BD9D9|nr:hypothetical protein [Spirosoma sp. KUDC1026]QKZ14674.1 hypothetical protein HU175_19390 [Spirosoma sp. KUDC1026]